MDHTSGYLMRVRKLPSVELDLVKESFVKSFCQLFKLANKGLLICRESANMVAQSDGELAVDLDFMKTQPQQNHLLFHQF